MTSEGIIINKPKDYVNEMWRWFIWQSDVLTYWRNVIWYDFICFTDNKYVGRLYDSKKKREKKENLKNLNYFSFFIFFIYLRRGMLHIYLVSFISYTKVHLFISCTIVQLIYFYFIHLTDTSHSHLPYLLLLIVHRISTSFSLSFFQPIPSLETRSVFR